MAFPAFRVFVCGVELTEDVTSVVINSHDGRAPNRCTITLANELDKYIVTAKDILNINQAGGSSIVSTGNISIPKSLRDLSAKAQLLITEDEQFVPDTNDMIGDAVETAQAKKAIVNTKLQTDSSNISGYKVVSDPVVLGDAGTQAEAKALRYPFIQGHPIFHPNDPIRVFFRDPFDVTTWYHEFCGFLSDMDETSDANNRQQLSLTFEDPTKLLRYARVTTNPGIIDRDAVAVLSGLTGSIVQGDAVIPTSYSSAFVNFSMPDIFTTLIFGARAAETWDRFESAKATEQKTLQGKQPTGAAFKLEGVGRFTTTGSAIFIYGGGGATSSAGVGVAPFNVEIPVSSLAEYQSYIDHRVTFDDLVNMRWAKSSTPAPFASTINDVVKAIGSDPNNYPVDGGRLIMLLPAGMGQGNKRIMEKDPISTFALQTEWTTRAEILFSVIERVQFSFYCSPRGDLLLEMPLYDFDPRDFARPSATRASSQQTAMAPLDYSEIYDIGLDEIKAWSNTQTDDKVYTQVACSEATIQNYNFGHVSDFEKPQVVNLYGLWPLYGIRNAPITPRGYIATKDAAQLYAYISINRLNADAFSSKVHTIPNLNAWVNRPFLIHGRNFVATTKAVTQTIQWGQQGHMNTALDLYAVRGWSGAVDGNGDLIYTPLGGSASKPLDYKRLFQTRAEQQSKTPGFHKS